jgi:hypothetical protein
MKTLMLSLELPEKSGSTPTQIPAQPRSRATPQNVTAPPQVTTRLQFSTKHPLLLHLTTPYLHNDKRQAIMKLSSLLTVLFSTSISAAAFGWNSGNDQVHLKEEFTVPGANPLLFCEDPANNILTIDKVDLDPNPPLA